MPQTTEVFKQWRPKIGAYARYIATKYDIEYEDVKSQAYELFMKAINRNKNKDILPYPYLKKSLLPLKQYAQKVKRQQSKVICVDDFIENENDLFWSDSFSSQVLESRHSQNNMVDIYKCPSFEEFQAAMERMEAKVKLSEDAQKLLEYITSRCWEIDPRFMEDGKETRRPYFGSTANRMFLEYRWNNRRTKKAWDELGQWWKEENRNGYMKEEGK